MSRLDATAVFANGQSNTLSGGDIEELDSFFADPNLDVLDRTAAELVVAL